MASISKVGNLEFEQLEPDELRSIPIGVQALDNQWLPRRLLTRAMKYGIERVEEQLNDMVRSEYMRALINGEQVILNRAFLYNNPAIVQDYSIAGKPREAFKALLQDGVIIPSLYLENSPADEPTPDPSGKYKGFDTIETGPANWRKVCEEVRTHCVRMSWDDTVNNTLAPERFSQRFGEYATGVLARNIDIYIRDLSLDPSARDSLRSRLREVTDFCNDILGDGKVVVRNDLYKKFITAGVDPSQRKYDGTGNSPFASELKQLFDLAYNRNVPDALEGYLLTPVDSVSRTVLQEDKPFRVINANINGSELLTLLRDLLFTLNQQIQQPGAYLSALSLLGLPDIQQIRRTDEWLGYAKSMQDLLKEPDKFAEGNAQAFFQNYKVLMERITQLCLGRGNETNLLASWQPTVELAVNIAGGILDLQMTSSGPAYRFSAAPTRLNADVVVHLAIRGSAEVRGQAKLDNSVDLYSYRMNNATQQWREMSKQLSADPAFRDVATLPGRDEATLNFQAA